MNFTTMSDEQIIEEIAKNLENMRIEKQISSEDLASKGGHNAQTYSNFINRNTNIRIGTIIQIFRGIDELDKLQKAFEYKIPYSPTGKNTNLPTRVFKQNKNTSNIEWGDEK